MRRTAGVLVGLILLGTAACSSETPEENTAQACSAAEELSTALDNFDTTLTPDATVAEVQSARDEVRQAWQAFDSAASDVAQDRGQALDDAWESFNGAVDDVEGGESVSDAVDSLKDDAAAVKAARDSISDELGC